ncbi:MAG: P-loop NTPase, partial [Gemmatimonadota bacterium]
LATVLAARGLRIGVVDADLNGPSVARMLGAGDASLQHCADGILPARGSADVAFVSTDLLLSAADAPMRWKGPRDDGFLWRGALEAGTLREFLSDIVWGELDFLFIDVPPGTDRIERLLDLVAIEAVLLITTPSAAALHVVGKSARLLREAGVENIGLVVNMSAYTCPSCGDSTAIFPRATPADYHLLGDLTPWVEIPFDPALAATTDSGHPIVLAEPHRPAAVALRDLADRLQRETDS